MTRALSVMPLPLLPWTMPPTVQAAMSTRNGWVDLRTGVFSPLAGASGGSYAGLNLGNHVGDAAAAVAQNRALLGVALAGRPVYLQQVHGVEVVELHAHTPDGAVADACSTRVPGVACTIMVADCLPVLLCNRSGTQVAALHAGWRGLAAGVVEATVRSFTHDAPEALQAWLGPCIGPRAFEVGAEVRAAFAARYGAAVRAFFIPQGAKFLADLPGLARLALAQAGVQEIAGHDGSPAWCTYSNAADWFSHRRESQRGMQSGRLAASVWLRAS